MLSLLLSAAFSVTAFAATPKLHVAIDPGHGGKDCGATRGNARESDIVLKVSLALRDMLAGDSRFETSMTRTSDMNLTLQERVKKAEKNKADIFISIHANTSVDRKARGVEIYFQNHLPPDEETLFLAASEDQMARSSAQADETLANDEPTKKNDVLAILEDLKRHTRMKSSNLLSKKLLENWNLATNHDPGNIIRQAPFYVVSKTQMPSVLVELGFISNPKEADRLITPAYQKEVAERIYRGLVKYKEFVDKSDSINLH